MSKYRTFSVQVEAEVGQSLNNYKIKLRTTIFDQVVREK